MGVAPPAPRAPGPIESGGIPGGGRNPYVDSLRAIAALSVLVYHLAVTRSPPDWLRPFLVDGTFGVTLFFLISGYVLYRPFTEARLRGQPLAVIPYGARRVLRIAPAFWVALVAALLFGSAADDIELRELPQILAFGQIYSTDTVLVGIGQAWSLDVEVVFYALLPALVALVFAGRAERRGARELAVIGALLVVGVLWTSVFVEQGAGLGTTAASVGDLHFYWPFRFLGYFGLGMGLASLAVRISRAERVPPLGRLYTHPGLAWLAVPACVYVLSRPGIGLVWRDLAGALAALALLWPAVIEGRTRSSVATRLLGWRPLVAMGTISYGIYLYHFAIITRADTALDGVAGLFGAILWIGVVLVGSILAGAISWKLVEQPAIRASRRFGR